MSPQPNMMLIYQSKFESRPWGGFFSIQESRPSRHEGLSQPSCLKQPAKGWWEGEVAANIGHDRDLDRTPRSISLAPQ